MVRVIRDYDYSEDKEIEDNRRFVNDTVDKYKKFKLKEEGDGIRRREKTARDKSKIQ